MTIRLAAALWVVMTIKECVQSNPTTFDRMFETTRRVESHSDETHHGKRKNRERRKMRERETDER